MDGEPKATRDALPGDEGLVNSLRHKAPRSVKYSDEREHAIGVSDRVLLFMKAALHFKST